MSLKTPVPPQSFLNQGTSDVRAETLVTCLGLRPIGYPPWTCRPVCSPPPLQRDSPHAALHTRFQPALCGAVTHITSLPWRHCLPFTSINPSLVRILLLSRPSGKAQLSTELFLRPPCLQQVLWSQGRGRAGVPTLIVALPAEAEDTGLPLRNLSSVCIRPKRSYQVAVTTY